LERNQKEEWSSSHFTRLAGDDILLAKDCFHHRTCRYFKELPLNPKINSPLEPYPKIAALLKTKELPSKDPQKNFLLLIKDLRKYSRAREEKKPKKSKVRNGSLGAHGDWH
jgi:hypothetical protein